MTPGFPGVISSFSIILNYSSSGRIWFNTIAKNAVGATADVANVFQTPGRY